MKTLKYIFLLLALLGGINNSKGQVVIADSTYLLRFTLEHFDVCGSCAETARRNRIFRDNGSGSWISTGWDNYRSDWEWEINDVVEFKTRVDPRPDRWVFQQENCSWTTWGTNSRTWECWTGGSSYKPAVEMDFPSTSSVCGQAEGQEWGNPSGWAGARIMARYAAPRLTTPFATDTEYELDNLCEETVTLSTSNWGDETYAWVVSANFDGPYNDTIALRGIGYPNGHILEVDEQQLIDAVGRQTNYYIRVLANSCFSDFDRSSGVATLTFLKKPPASITWSLIPPSCPNGVDAAVELNSFRNSDGTTYSLTNSIAYTIARDDSNLINVGNWEGNRAPSPGNPVVLTNTNSLDVFQFPEGSYTFYMEIEHNDLTCLREIPFDISDPSTPRIGSITESESLVCPEDVGELSIQMANSFPTYRYRHTLRGTGGNSGFVRNSILLARNTSTYTFENVPAGTYRWEVDVNGCPDLAMAQNGVEMSLPNNPISAAFQSSTNVQCRTQSNGSLRFGLSGGTGSYTYSRNGSSFAPVTQNPFTLGGLPAGDHTIYFRDGNQCETSASGTVGNPPALALTGLQVVQAIPCTGGNGTIRANISGGVGPFQYRITNGSDVDFTSPGTTSRNFTFPSQPAGLYTITVTGCNESVTDTITMSDPQFPLRISAVESFAENCPGDNTGRLRVSIADGQGDYRIQMDGGSIQNVLASPFTFSGLGATTHHFTVFDDNNCQVRGLGTVDSPPALSLVSAGVSQEIACANGNGDITISVENGNALFNYSLVGNQGTNRSIPNTSDRSVTFTNVPSQSYTITATDACNTEINTAAISLNEPQRPIAFESLTSTNALCTGSNDGRINLVITGGIPPYSTQIGSGSIINLGNDTTYSFTGLSSGAYDVNIWDGNNCPQSSSASVADPDGVTIDEFSISQPILCPGGSGELTVTAQGGAIDYLFELTGPQHASFTSSSSSHTFVGLPSGDYEVSVTSCGQMASGSPLTLPEPTNNVSFSTITPTPATCSSSSDGSLEVIAQDGALSYMVEIDGNGLEAMTGTSHRFSGLASGQHTIVLEDANQCRITTTAQVGLHPAISGSVTPQDLENVTCSGFDNGFVFITATGGNPSSSFEYQLEGGSFASANFFGNLSAQDYSFTIRDANETSCTSSGSFTITEPSPISIDQAEVTANVTCNGLQNGEITVSSSGGPSIHDYTLFRGLDLISEETQTLSMSFVNLGSGTYRVVVSSSVPGCQEETTLVINQPDALALSVERSDFNGYEISCANGTDGQIDLSTSGGTLPLTYSNTQLGSREATSLNQEVTYDNLGEGLYSLTITDNQGCSLDTTVELVAPAPLQASFELMAYQNGYNITCFGETDGQATILATGGVAPFTFGLTGELAQNAMDSAIFSGLSAGNYTYTLTDTNSCQVTGDLEISTPTALAIDYLTVPLQGSHHLLCAQDSNGLAETQVSGGSIPYLIRFNVNMADTISQVQNTAFSGLHTGTYDLHISDNQGCELDTTFDITAPDELAFSPSGISISDYNGFGVSCPHSQDGGISTQQVGGTLPYFVSISSSSEVDTLNGALETSSFDNLSYGIHVIYMTDNNGCSIDTTLEITTPDSLNINTINETKSNNLEITCKGVSDGNVWVFRSGGTGPFLLNVNGLNQQPITDSLRITDLPSGTFVLEIVDANGCFISDTTSLREPDSLLLDQLTSSEVGLHNLGCFGDTTARVDLVTLGGALPQRFYLNNSLIGISDSLRSFSFENLSSGSYDVLVRDVAGCETVTAFDITEPSELSIDPSLTEIIRPECGGDQTGSISVMGLGGVQLLPEGYLYTIQYLGDTSHLPYSSELSQVASQAVFDSLLGGSYLLTVSDENSCTYEEQLHVNTNQSLEVDVEGSTIACKADSTGYGELRIDGGTAPYDLEIRILGTLIAAQQDIAAQEPFNISGLPEGEYRAIITDDSGCVYLSDDYAIHIQGPELPLDLHANTLDASCKNTATGSVELFSTGGWDSTSQVFGTELQALSLSDTSFSGLLSGSYTYYVRDSSGCEDSIEVAISEPDSLISFVQSIVEPTCFGFYNGEIEVASIGGTAPYRFSLDNGAEWQTSEILDSLPSGGYTVLVEDSLGCTTSSTALLNQPDSLILSILNIIHTQCDFSLGSAEVSTTGGTLPYTYQWSDSNGVVLDTNAVVNQLAEGNYTAIVTDAQSCIDSMELSILNNDLLHTDAIIINHVLCNGANDGAAQALLIDIQAPYTIDWSDGQQGEIASGLTPGIHSAIITDSVGCEDTVQVEVLEPPVLTLSLDKTDQSCHNICDGTITSNVTGGAGNIEYIWNTQETTSNITGLCLGMYVVTISDSNACVLSDSIEIGGRNAGDISLADSVLYTCEGQPILIDLPGWVSYLWTYPEGSEANTTSINTAATGTYSIQVEDTSGCYTSANFQLLESNEAFLAEFLIPAETYVGDTVVTVSLSTPAPDNILWTFDTTTVQQISVDSIYQFLVFEEAGVFDIAITAQQGECFATQTKSIVVYEAEQKSDDGLDLGFKETGIMNSTLYPNPSEGDFSCKITLHEADDLTLDIYDELGNRALSHSVPDFVEGAFEFSMHDPKPGIYFLIIRTSNDIAKMRFTVK